MVLPVSATCRQRLRAVERLAVHTADMLYMAVAGTAVLAFVSWVSLREARRMSGTFIPDARAPAAAAPTPVGVEVRPRPAVSPPSRSRVTALGDATVAGADDDEALAAAAALWQVLAYADRD